MKLHKSKIINTSKKKSYYGGSKINNSSLRTPLNRKYLSELNKLPSDIAEYRKNLYFRERAQKNPVYPKRPDIFFEKTKNKINWNSGLVKEHIMSQNCESYDMNQCQNNPDECRWNPLSRPPQCKSRKGFVYKSKPKIPVAMNVLNAVFQKYKPEIDEIITLSY